MSGIVIKPCSDPAYTTVNTLADLKTAITSAKPGSLRVRGAMHSIQEAIVGTSTPPTTICLGADFQKIEFDVASAGLVKVGAGIRLGGDPDENVPANVGMLDWLATRPQGANGLSVPDLGGITHQTVGGFLSTGSSGGSLTYSFDDSLVSITFMDGTGKLWTVTPTSGDFYAMGVSMGLFGVITEIEIKPIPRFAIFGDESTTDIDAAKYKPFAEGPSGLEAYLRARDYCRIMWWPQDGVNKLVTWHAKQGAIPDGFTPKPYQEIGDPNEDPVSYPDKLDELIEPIGTAIGENLPALFALIVEELAKAPKEIVEFAERTINSLLTEKGESFWQLIRQAMSSEVQQIGVDAYFSMLGNRKTNDLAGKLFTTIFGSEEAFEQVWSPLIMNGIFLIDNDAKKVKGPQKFSDYGDTGLPMDNQISDIFMPTEFTELWIPIDQTAAVMNALQGLYSSGGYAATGTYACELYAAKSSQFWLSPAFNTDVIRVDVFWFARNGDQTPQSYYQQFWDLLRPFNFRPHWGKYLPPSSTYGASYYGTVYPRLGDFLKLRAKYDPNQIFVTDYWRDQFQIPKPS